MNTEYTCTHINTRRVLFSHYSSVVAEYRYVPMVLCAVGHVRLFDNSACIGQITMMLHMRVL